MSEAFYLDARLYDPMFPGGGPAVDFYRAGANRARRARLGTRVRHGHKLIPSRPTGIRAPAWTSRQTCWLRLSVRRTSAV